MVLEEKDSVILFLDDPDNFRLFVRRPGSSLWRRYAGRLIKQGDGGFLLEADDPSVFNLRLRELRRGRDLYSLKMGRDYYILSPRRENIVRRIIKFLKFDRRN